MKNSSWLIAASVITAVAVGVSMAAVSRWPLEKGQGRISTTANLGNQTNRAESKLNEVESSELENFPHQRILLEDEAEFDRDFFEFRAQLRQAVAERNTDFVTQILPPALPIGFGRPQSIAELNLDDPNAQFWWDLEKAIAISCAKDSEYQPPNIAEETAIWACPNVTAEFNRLYPPPAGTDGVDWQVNQVIIVGEDVNVRSQPTQDSSVIGIVSHEVIQIDRVTLEQQLQEQPQEYNPIDGWTPVILPNDRKGYVYNRYAYFPLAYRAIFAKQNERWQLLAMPGGD